MSHDALLRLAAVVAAAALVAAPYYGQALGWLAAAAEAAKRHRYTIGRIVAAGLIVGAAWGKLPMPTLPAAAPRVAVETPSDAMQRLVTPVAASLRRLGPVDRALWAEAWEKAAVVVAGDAVTAEVAFTDTRSLRIFTTLALDIAWRRIGGHQPGEVPGLREAVEAVYNTAMGREVVPVTADVRAKYVELAKAIAWAGVNGG